MGSGEQNQRRWGAGLVGGRLPEHEGEAGEACVRGCFGMDGWVGGEAVVGNFFFSPCRGWTRANANANANA